jgi:hypothetical protein
MSIIRAENRFRVSRKTVEDFVDAHGCDIWVCYRKSNRCGWLSEIHESDCMDALRYLRAGSHIHAVQCAKTIQIDDKSGMDAIVGYDPEWVFHAYGDKHCPDRVEVGDEDGYMITLSFVQTDFHGVPKGSAA